MRACIATGIRCMGAKRRPPVFLPVSLHSVVAGWLVNAMTDWPVVGYHHPALFVSRSRSSSRSRHAKGTMSAEEIAGAFMQHYYGTLDSNIAGLGPLYVRTTARLLVPFCSSRVGPAGEVWQRPRHTTQPNPTPPLHPPHTAAGHLDADVRGAAVHGHGQHLPEDGGAYVRVGGWVDSWVWEDQCECVLPSPCLNKPSLHKSTPAQPHTHTHILHACTLWTEPGQAGAQRAALRRAAVRGPEQPRHLRRGPSQGPYRGPM